MYRITFFSKKARLPLYIGLLAMLLGLLILCPQAASAQALEFCTGPWAGVLTDLAAARDLASQARELARDNPDKAAQLAAQAAALFIQTADRSKTYVSLYEERQDTGLYDFGTFGNGDPVTSGYLPKLATGYAYFEAASLTADQNQKKSLFGKAKSYLLLPNLSKAPEAYDSILIHKMSLLSAMASLDNNATSTSEFDGLLKQLLAIYDPGKKNKKNDADEQDLLETIGHIIGEDTDKAQQRVNDQIARLLGSPTLQLADKNVAGEGAYKGLSGTVQSPVPVSVEAVGEDGKVLDTRPVIDGRFTLGVSLTDNAPHTVTVRIALDKLEGSARTLAADFKWQAAQDKATVQDVAAVKIEPNDGAPLQVAGREVSGVFHIRNLNPGDRIQVTDEKGQPLLPEKTFTQATADYPLDAFPVAPNADTRVNIRVMRDGKETARLAQPVTITSATIPQVTYETISSTSAVTLLLIKVKDYAPLTKVTAGSVTYPVSLLKPYNLPARADGLQESWIALPVVGTSVPLLKATTLRESPAIVATTAETLSAEQKTALLAGLPSGLSDLAAGDLDKAQAVYMAIPDDNAERGGEARTMLKGLYEAQFASASALSGEQQATALKKLTDLAQRVGKKDELDKRIAEVSKPAPAMAHLNPTGGHTDSNLVWVRFTLADLPAGQSVTSVVVDGVKLAPRPDNAYLLALKSPTQKSVSLSVVLNNGEALADTVSVEQTGPLPAELQADGAAIAREMSKPVTEAAATSPVWLVESARRLSRLQAEDQLASVQKKIAQLGQAGPSGAKAVDAVIDTLRQTTLALKRMEAHTLAGDTEGRQSLQQLSDLLDGYRPQLQSLLNPVITDTAQKDTQDNQTLMVRSLAQKLTLIVDDKPVVAQNRSEAGEWRVVLPKEAVNGKTQLRVKATAEDGLGNTYASTKTVGLKVDLVPVQVTLLTRQQTLTADKAKNLKMVCDASPPDRIKLIQWQVLDKEGKAMPTVAQAPQPFTLNAISQTIPSLPPGEYKVRVNVWDKSEATAEPASWDEAVIKVVEPSKGMAFLVGIDFYSDGYLRYMTSDAEKLKQELLKLGYPEDSIATVYGKVKINDDKSYRASVEMSPNIYFNPDTINTSRIPSGNLVSQDLLDKAFANFLKLAEQQGARHVILFYGGHGQVYTDPSAKVKVPTNVFRLPDGNLKWSDDWAQQLVNLPSAPTVIGYYDACRQASFQGVCSIGIDVNYFGFPSCKNKQFSYEDDPDPTKSINIKSGFFVEALIRAINQLSGKPVKVFDLYTAISKNLADIVQQAKAKRPELGEQSLPDIAGIGQKQQELPSYNLASGAQTH